jgi:Ca-activated chloride channel family protein
MTPIDLQLCPRKSALLLGHDNRLDVLVRVAGPPPPREAPAKKALNLALVIDKSGSMSGQPLHEAKRCAIAIIERLTPGDFVSVVAYDNHPELVWPARAITHAAGLREAVSAIREGGATALHDGWAAGAEQAALNVSKAGISRVLLLSDGGANAGLTDPGQIASHCAQMAEMGVSTSTYGLGASFNETLMLAMARSGGGNGYYGQTAADLMGPFQEEFDLLQAICARNLRLRLSAGPGVKLRVTNDLREKDGGWRLPDLAYGSEAWAMVRLSLGMDRVAVGAQAPIPLLKASLDYDTDGGSCVAGPAMLSLPSLPVSAYVALLDDEAVARRAQEVRVAKFQRDAAEAARQGDWDRVDGVLEKARTEARGNAWLSAAMPSLERYARARDREQFAKEATFKSERMMSRLSVSDEGGGFSAASELAQPSFLRRRPEEGKTDPGG